MLTTIDAGCRVMHKLHTVASKSIAQPPAFKKMIMISLGILVSIGQLLVAS